MDMNDEELLEDLAISRNLKQSTIYEYKATIKIYSEFNQKNFSELITEAEQEEEAGIRWKHRKIKDRLIKFRNYLNKKYSHNTAKNIFIRIKSIYKQYDIEIHNIPYASTKNTKEHTPITFKDLPDKDIIKKALKISNPLMRSIILFMSSSGCARTETLNLTIQDFIDATKEYHNSNNIYEIINLLKDRDDIIPTFHIKRQKTNKHYIAFCSPESVEEIVNYLLSRKNTLKNQDKLFKVNMSYFTNYFKEINESLNLGKRGAFNRFRSHMLRKFHASQLYNDSVPLEIVDTLQGRGKDSTHSSYFMEDPEKLKEVYVEHLGCLTINLDVNNLDLKSPEYIQLEEEVKAKDDEIDELRSFVEKTTTDIFKKIEEIRRNS